MLGTVNSCRDVGWTYQWLRKDGEGREQGQERSIEHFLDHSLSLSQLMSQVALDQRQHVCACFHEFVQLPVNSCTASASKTICVSISVQLLAQTRTSFSYFIYLLPVSFIWGSTALSVLPHDFITPFFHNTFFFFSCFHNTFFPSTALNFVCGKRNVEATACSLYCSLTM